MALYYREHRRQPRVAVHWPAEVQVAGGESGFSFTAVNVSSGGICLRGDQPVVFTLEDEGLEAIRFLLRLTLPEGRVLEGIELDQVWETRQEGQVLSGWRFAGMPAAAWQVLQQEAGLAPPVAREMMSASHDPWDEDEIELWDYVRTLIKRRWVIVGCALFAALAAFAFVRQQPALYQAQAQILPVGETDYLSRREDLSYGELVTTPYVAVLESVPLNRQVALDTFDVVVDDQTARMNLIDYLQTLAEVQEKPEALTEVEWARRQEARALGWLGGMSEFAQRKEDRVIEIIFNAEDPNLAAQVANAYIEELKGHRLRSSGAYTQQNIVMAQTRLDTLSRQLEEAEKILEKFRTDNQLLLKDSTRVELFLPQVATQYARKKRELALKQSLYNTVANHFELLRLQESKNAAGIEVISLAEPPLSSNKSYPKYVVLGGAVGVFLGVFLAFFLEYIDNKRASGDLETLREAWQEDRARVRRLLRF